MHKICSERSQIRAFMFRENTRHQFLLSEIKQFPEVNLVLCLKKTKTIFDFALAKEQTTAQATDDPSNVP